MSRLWALLLLAVGAGSLACASARVRPTAGDDLLFPSWRPGQVRREAAREIERAWRDVLAARWTAAERRLGKLLQRDPGLIPAETGLAYARYGGGRLVAAAAGFGAVLERAPEYVSALAGAGLVALRGGDPERALGYYRRALRADPNDARLRRNVANLKLQITERRVGAGRAARSEGRTADAALEFRAALEAAPEVPEVRLELAGLLVEQGDVPGALAVLEADSAGDRSVLLRLGELLAGQGENERALSAYRAMLARDPADPEALQRSSEVRHVIEFEQMPEEYQRIHSAPGISRAELAALVSVKVTALSRLAPGPIRVAVDISGSWAREHIIRLLALDVIDVYPNHTFQPGAAVRRGDLARTVGQVLRLLGWQAQLTPTLADMSPNNLYYEGASSVVAAGLMDLTPGGSFEAWRPVSGADAVTVLDGLVRLVGP